MELLAQILELSRKEEKSGIPVIDNMVSDAKGYTRMATEQEIEELWNLYKAQEAA